MRDYKFRGLRTDGRGWVYGDRVRTNQFTYIVIASCNPVILLPPSSFIEVDKKTVGIFTGLKDNDGTGKEVYKSDLFEVIYSNVPNGFEAMNFKKEVKIYIGEVVFKFGSFKIKTFHPDHQEYVYMDLHTFLKNDEKVIIGNVFQNPEFLES